MFDSWLNLEPIGLQNAAPGRAHVADNEAPALFQERGQAIELVVEPELQKLGGFRHKEPNVRGNLADRIGIGEISFQPRRKLSLRPDELHLRKQRQPGNRRIDLGQRRGEIVTRQKEAQLLALEFGRVVGCLFLLRRGRHGLVVVGVPVRMARTRSRPYSPGRTA